MFATEASIILTDAGMDVTDDQDSSQLGEALRSRQIIAQAEGMIMEREAISEDNPTPCSVISHVDLAGRCASAQKTSWPPPANLRHASNPRRPVGGEHG